jgi:hypothetical protein
MLKTQDATIKTGEVKDNSVIEESKKMNKDRSNKEKCEFRRQQRKAEKYDE